MEWGHREEILAPEPDQGLGDGEEALGWRHFGGNVLHAKPSLSTAVLSSGEVFMFSTKTSNTIMHLVKKKSVRKRL